MSAVRASFWPLATNFFVYLNFDYSTFSDLKLNQIAFNNESSIPFLLNAIHWLTRKVGTCTGLVTRIKTRSLELHESMATFQVACNCILKGWHLSEESFCVYKLYDMNTLREKLSSSIVLLEQLDKVILSQYVFTFKSGQLFSNFTLSSHDLKIDSIKCHSFYFAHWWLILFFWYTWSFIKESSIKFSLKTLRGILTKVVDTVTQCKRFTCEWNKMRKWENEKIREMLEVY